MAPFNKGSSCEVAIVGAGVTGLALAWELAGHGAAVSVLERSGVAAGASGIQPGGVRQQWSNRVNCVLARESLAFYREIGERLGTHVRPHFSACGYAFVAHSERRLSELEAAVALQNELGISSRLLTPEECAEVVPGLDASAVCGAAYNGEDGYFDHAREPVEAFAEAATARGAVLRIAEVGGLDPEGDGWRLRLSDGTSLSAPAVVVAAGRDTASVLAGLAVLPLESEPRHLFLSEPLEERLLEPLVVAGELGLAAKQLADGRVLASDLAARGDPDLEAARWRATVRRGIEALLPRLRTVAFPHLVSGVYDLTPDRNPLVGPLPDVPGLWVAAGFSGHGFMLAPALARRLADALCGAELDPLLEPFAPGRFAAGRSAPETEIV